MRILILSGSLGRGHDSLADACSAALRSLGHETRTMDAMRLLGEGGGRVGEWVFRQLIAIPGVYDALHFSAMVPGRRLAHWIEEAALRRMVPRLRRTFAEWTPDLALSVFATGAGVIDRLKAEHPALISVVFNTDACTHRMWVHPSTDLFLVTSDLSAATVRRYRTDATIAVVPAPVRSGFSAASSRAEARANVAVPDDARCVLLMSGAWGLGPVAESARTLAAAGYHVLAVAGANERLARRLEEIARHEPRVIPFGYTDRIPELMAAADVVVTSSGDTCAEARVMERPLVVLDVVPGHGRENVLHELELGGAEVSSPNPNSIRRAVDTVLRGEHVVPRPMFSSPRDWEQGFLSALDKLGVGVVSRAPESGPGPHC